MKGFDGFSLKVVAIVAMTVNHFAGIFFPFLPYPVYVVLFAVGGITFPVMAFLVAEGYRHTHDVRGYALRLGGFALVSQIPWFLFMGGNLNVLFTLLLGLALCVSDDRCADRFVFGCLFAAVILLSVACDWHVSGPFLVWAFKVFGDKHGVSSFEGVVFPLLAWLAISCMWSWSAAMHIGDASVLLVGFAQCSVGLLAGSFLLCRYNGRRGRDMRWFFYAYYPVHISVLGAALLAARSL